MSTNIQERYDILNHILYKAGLEVMSNPLGFTIVTAIDKQTLAVTEGPLFHLLNTYLLDGLGTAKIVAEQVQQLVEYSHLKQSMKMAMKELDNVACYIISKNLTNDYHEWRKANDNG